MTNGQVTDNRVRVMTSTLGGNVPDDFNFADKPPFYLAGLSGDGIVFGKLVIDIAGAITGRTIEKNTTLPVDTDTEFHVRIGSYSIDSETHRTSVAQDRFGPVFATVCRKWFESTVKHGVTFT